MKFLKWQSGFSFTDTMVAAVLLGFVALGVLKLADFQNSSVKASSVDLKRYLSILREYIAEPEACRKNFIGLMSGQDVHLPYLVNSNDQRVVEVGDLVGNGAYKVKFITLNGHRPNSLRSDIVIDFESTSKDNGILLRQKKRISVLTKVDPQKNVIQECTDQVAITTDELIEELCYDADPQFQGDCSRNFDSLVEEVKKEFCDDPSSFLTYDVRKQRCAPLDADKRCFGGLIQGFNEKGPICYYPPQAIDAARILPPPKVCLASPGKFKWSTSKTAAGIVECGNEELIEMAEGNIATAFGNQKFQYGPPFTLERRLHARGEVKIKCTADGLEVIQGTCVPSCVVSTTNLRFPVNAPLDQQCFATPDSQSNYKFGLLHDFIVILNGTSVTIKGKNGNWVKPFCNSDGTVDWSNSRCLSDEERR